MNTTWHRAGALLALLVVTTLVVLPVLENEFVYDDIDIIVEGTVIHDLANLPKLFVRHAVYVTPDDPDMTGIDTYRPMTLMSFFWDSAVSGYDPFAYHMTNLVMHLLCIALVFALLQLVLQGHWGFALLGAAWFALSPHPNTAQIWINGRSDLFCTAYGLAAILVWRGALDAEPGRRRIVLHAAAGLLFFAGLLSKETLLMVLPALWLWPERGSAFSLATRIRRVLPLATAGAVYLGVRSMVLGGVHVSSGGGHLLEALQYLAPLEVEGFLGALGPRKLYLRFLFDEFERLSPFALVAFAAVFAAIAAGIVAIRKRHPVVSWGLFWFIIVLSPACLVAATPWPGFGRFLYLPSVGLAVALAACAELVWRRFPRGRVAQSVVAGAYLVFLATSLHSWVDDFKNVETLYGSAILRNPEGGHAYGWLGMAYRKLDREEDSIGPLAKAHELLPNQGMYTQHLLYALINTKREGPALELATECVARHPHNAEECHLYLYANAQLSRPADAMNHLLDCLKYDEKGDRCYEAFAHAVNAHELGPVYRQLADARLQDDDMAHVRTRTAEAMRAN